ncbi:hypothetical protein IJI31_03760 [bacterium]|nr:hypothetical protein [bacterium]
MQFFKDKRITMLFKEYSYVGLGVYVLILKELQKGKVSIDYISVISKENGLSEEFIKSLIDDCCEKFKTKERGSLITKDENYFWSDEILKEKMKQEKSKQMSSFYGKKGGRPKYEVKNNYVTNPVNLTPEQVKSLKNKFGENVIEKSIEIFTEYIQKNKKLKEKSHYWYFRKDGWLINTAIKELEQDSKYTSP